MQQQDFQDVWTTQSTGTGGGGSPSSNGQVSVTTTDANSGGTDHREDAAATLTTTTTVEGDGPLMSAIDASPFTLEETKLLLDLANVALFVIAVWVALSDGGGR